MPAGGNVAMLQALLRVRIQQIKNKKIDKASPRIKTPHHEIDDLGVNLIGKKEFIYPMKYTMTFSQRYC